MAYIILNTAVALRKKSNIPSSILWNTVRNITNIWGYSAIFLQNIVGILVIFGAEYVGIKRTRYSVSEYC